MISTTKVLFYGFSEEELKHVSPFAGAYLPKRAGGKIGASDELRLMRLSYLQVIYKAEHNLRMRFSLGLDSTNLLSP